VKVSHDIIGVKVPNAVVKARPLCQVSPKYMCIIRATLTCLVLFLTTTLNAAESKCFGTVSNGRLENGVQLPTDGRNFSAYNTLGVMLGRNYVHSKVSEIVLAAFRGLENTEPNKKFVYGETGWASGGRMRPHKTHRNGTSVDFMVPVVNSSGESVPLPTSVMNKFGYNIDFDGNAKYKNYTIDFEALAEHLYQLDKASKIAGSRIALVIFDPPYLPKLFATKRGEYLRTNIHFMKGKAWIRHDEHYHVDFAIPCEPING
jgi:penicillin-insensitive murein endopeptidase